MEDTLQAVSDNMNATPPPQGYVDAIRYAGFWRRVGGHTLDLLILSPWVAINLWVNLVVDNGPLYLFLPAVLIALWYNVYLVRKNGGTPGQRVLDLRIKKAEDLSRIDYTNALWRYFIYFVSWASGAIGQMIAAASLSGANGSMFERVQALSTHTPKWAHIANAVFGCFAFVDILWIFTNPRRRQIVDFLAQTVIVVEESKDPDQR